MNWLGRGHKSDELKEQFWAVAKAATQRQYEDRWIELYETKEKAAFDMVSYVNPKQFCKCFIKKDSMIELIDNNLFEALNKELLPAREMPVISLFEHMRRYIMRRQVRKRKQAARLKNGLGKKVWKVLNNLQI